jgi:hypothetical protein
VVAVAILVTSYDFSRGRYGQQSFIQRCSFSMSGKVSARLGQFHRKPQRTSEATRFGQKMFRFHRSLIVLIHSRHD